MNNKTGSGLLVILIVGVLLIAAAVMFFAAGRAPATGGGGGLPAFALSTAVSRTPTGVNAVVTVANGGSSDFKNVRLTRVAIRGMNGTAAMPLTIGQIPRGARTSVAVPFSGLAPAPNASVTVEIDYSYDFGWRGSGSGSSGVTSVLP